METSERKEPNAAVMLGDAARGMAQQMVLWGHDVRHPGGNALVRFGLSREPSPGLQGTSCYGMAWEGGAVELHGAVVSWTAPDGRAGCVFCRDKGRIDLWLGGKAPVPGAEGGVSGEAEVRWEAFRPFLRWLIDYEAWVLEHLGAGWRTGAWKALKRLPKGKSWLAPPLALEWWRLALAGEAPRPKHLKEAA